jgi:hypothetical protein
MKDDFLKWKDRYGEEFLFGFFAPMLIIVLDWLVHMFGFLYYFFPVVLAFGFLFCLITKRWGAVVGIISFVIFSFIFRGFLSSFWSWIMADNEIVKKMLK